MAENQDDRSREDLSEEPSQYRLEEFRKQGRVAQSRELTGMIALLACGSALYVASPTLMTQLTDFMREIFRTDISSRMNLSDPQILWGLMFKAIKVLGWVVLPVAFVGFTAAAISSFAQVGSIFSTEPLAPDFSRVDPIKGAQRFFSMKQVIEGLRMFVRFSIVVAIAYGIVKANVFESPKYSQIEPSQLLKGFGDTGKVIFLSLCSVLIIFAGVDFWLQRWEFSKQLRLTKQEAKQEQKEHEGDPLLKARVRSIQRDVARKRMMNAVKKADVIITNPTHIAVAIIYDRENMQAPKVIAKGADFIAQKIKKIASEAGVPMVENVPLARTLYKTVKINQFVPRNLYQAVAEVLAYVYRLKSRKF